MLGSKVRSWLRRNAVVIPAAFLFAVIAISGTLTYQRVGMVIPQVQTTRLSSEAIDRLDAAITNVFEAETGQRGFLLTGRSEYLQSYRDALQRMPEDLRRLEQLVHDDPAQYQRFLAFRDAIAAKLTELNQTLAAYRTGGTNAAIAIVTTDRGKTLMDEIRRVAASMHIQAERVRTTNRQQIVVAGNHALAMIVITTTVATILLLLTFVYIARSAEMQAVARDRAEKARQASEDANRIKDQFIATVSHELRTPLTAILGWSRILGADSRDPDLMSEGLGVIQNCAKAQAKLIDDLLDVSRILSGKLRLSCRTIDIADAVRTGIDSVRPSAAAKGVAITQFLENDIRVIGDPDRLQQVVWNLLTNAVKFTTRGGTVFVSLTRKESHAVVEVRDSGEGIDAGFLPYVFEPFRQADGSKARVHKGLGLGLSIVKYLVEAHGGAVTVWSEGKGAGSTFRISLPIMPFVHSEPAGESTEISVGDFDEIPLSLPEPDSLSGMTVLVIDDHQPTLDVLTSVLRAAGAEAVGASSAAEALRLLDRTCPDVVVSDIGMPGEDGLSFITKMRALPEPCGRARAIALTAYVRTEDRDAILASGFNAYLAKPVEPIELVNAIHDVLRQQADVER